MENIKYIYLKKPKIPHVNGFFNWGFIEKYIGVHDLKEKQICKAEEGYISPWIETKTRYYNSYVNNIYLQAVKVFEVKLKEVLSKDVELKIMTANDTEDDNTNTSEESMRQASHFCVRRKEILKRLAEIKAEVEMEDEALLHHIERSQDVLRAHIFSYWRGVLKASTEKTGFFPHIREFTSAAVTAYEKNKKMLINVIDKSLKTGGIDYEMEEE